MLLLPMYLVLLPFSNILKMLTGTEFSVSKLVVFTDRYQIHFGLNCKFLFESFFPLPNFHLKRSHISDDIIEPSALMVENTLHYWRNHFWTCIRTHTQRGQLDYNFATLFFISTLESSRFRCNYQCR